jgi:hypothetical protein
MKENKATKLMVELRQGKNTGFTPFVLLSLVLLSLVLLSLVLLSLVLLSLVLLSSVLLSLVLLSLVLLAFSVKAVPLAHSWHRLVSISQQVNTV